MNLARYYAEFVMPDIPPSVREEDLPLFYEIEWEGTRDREEEDADDGERQRQDSGRGLD